MGSPLLPHSCHVSRQDCSKQFNSPSPWDSWLLQGACVNLCACRTSWVLVLPLFLALSSGCCRVNRLPLPSLFCFSTVQTSNGFMITHTCANTVQHLSNWCAKIALREPHGPVPVPLWCCVRVLLCPGTVRRLCCPTGAARLTRRICACRCLTKYFCPTLLLPFLRSAHRCSALHCHGLRKGWWLGVFLGLGLGFSGGGRGQWGVFFA